jgi:Predicted membrane protein
MTSTSTAGASGEQDAVAGDDNRRIAVGYARGFMGGMLVGVPAMLTMELWWEGFFVPAWRLLVLLAVNSGVLLILQHYSGLTHKKIFPAQIRAAVVAYGIGILTSALCLFALGVLHGDLRIRELAGDLVLQSMPVSIGASVAMSEFGGEHREVERRRARAGYWGALGMALAGAMLFGFSISGTEEPLLIAEQLTVARAITLMLLSLLQVFAIVYAVDFKQSSEQGAPQATRWPCCGRDSRRMRSRSSSVHFFCGPSARSTRAPVSSRRSTRSSRLASSRVSVRPQRSS